MDLKVMASKYLACSGNLRGVLSHTLACQDELHNEAVVVPSTVIADVKLEVSSDRDRHVKV